MASLIRLLIGVPVAGAITFMIFMLMQVLITIEEVTFEEAGDELQIVISEEVEEVQARRREVSIDDVAEVEPPPPPPQIEREVADQPVEDLSSTIGALPDFDAPELTGDNVSFDVSDRDAQPIVRIPPQYPPRAAERGVEGSCWVRFDVTPDGTPTNINVTRCDSSLFERSTIRAVERWRYEPRVDDGVAVWRRGVETRLDYQLQD